jgi:hypothetical protein
MKRLVIENVTDQFGRFIGQSFGVWDSVRRVMVFLPWPGARGRARAEAFIAQGEFEWSKK